LDVRIIALWSAAWYNDSGKSLYDSANLKRSLGKYGIIITRSLYDSTTLKRECGNENQYGLDKSPTGRA
jgi:hypothetical protein